MFNIDYDNNEDLNVRLNRLYDYLVRLEDYTHKRVQMFRRCNRSRDEVKKRFKTRQLEDDVNQIKEYSLEHNGELIKIAMERMEEKNIHVTLAKTALDARKVALEIIGEDPIVMQSSTDLTTEIGLRDALEQKGQRLETSEMSYRLFDICRGAVSYDKPVASHELSLDFIVKSFKENLGISVPHDGLEIGKILRQIILDDIERTRVGITGANSVSAIDGNIHLVFGMGNTARVALRDCHLAITGIEKVVPDHISAEKVQYLQSLYEGGVGGTSYYLTLSGPALSTHIGGAEVTHTLGAKEMHVILLDNGRSKAMKDPILRQVLKCIRCFTCHYFCPSYSALGPGVDFGYPIPGFGIHGFVGGRGTVMSSVVYGINKAVESGLFTCTLCGACVKECPVRIDTPTMIAELRRRLYKKI
ncbi:MAG: LUD domain-containing protein [Candidatus Ranarchaeia archaeon]